MAKVTRVASLEAHRAVGRATHGERRRDQGDAIVARERLELERELRALEKTINDYEEVIARLPDDLGLKPGQHRIKIGTFSLDLVVSTKPELRELVRLLKARRADLIGTEGRRRIAAAEALRDHLRGASVPVTPVAERRAAPTEPDEPEPTPPTRPSKWG